MAKTIIDTFKKNFQNLTGMSVDDFQAGKKNQQKIEARSGGNISARSGPATPIYDGEHTKALNDITKFYQKEFKVTPRATIYNSPEKLDFLAAGATSIALNHNAQHDVNLLNTNHINQTPYQKWIEEYMDGDAGQYHPKNAIGVATTPVHELGHAVALQLFEDTYQDSNKDMKESEENGWSFSGTDQGQLVKDSLKDIGIEEMVTSWDVDKNGNYRRTSDSYYSGKAEKEVSKISEYALSDPLETVAEALTDYYYNRNSAAPLSKAIVNRLKRKGQMYGVNQSGGISLTKRRRDATTEFMRNLRRYSAIQ